jgi:hypothetical protein
MAELELELLVFAADDISAVYRANAVLRDAQEEQDFSDATALARAPAGEHANYRGAGSRAILDMVRLMGFLGACDTDTRVALRDVPPAGRQDLIEKCVKVFELLDMKRPRVKDTPMKHITLARNVLRLLKIKLKSKRQGHGRTKRVTQYWLAPECEGFFGLAKDFNPYPNGPPHPSKVPYSQRPRTVNMLESHTVAAISARESSRVDPLLVTVPCEPVGFVLESLVACAGPLPPVTFGLPPAADDQAPLGDAELAAFQAELASAHESAYEMAELGCYADDQVPSDMELAEFQAEHEESADEMAELGCYAYDQGPNDAELAEFRTDLEESADEMMGMGCYADDSDHCSDV